MTVTCPVLRLSSTRAPWTAPSVFSYAVSRASSIALARTSKGRSFSRSINRSTEMSMSISTLLILAARRSRPVQLHLDQRAVDVDEANLAGLACHIEPCAVLAAGNDPSSDRVPLTQSHRHQTPGVPPPVSRTPQGP